MLEVGYLSMQLAIKSGILRTKADVDYQSGSWLKKWNFSTKFKDGGSWPPITEYT